MFVRMLCISFTLPSYRQYISATRPRSVLPLPAQHQLFKELYRRVYYFLPQRLPRL